MPYIMAGVRISAVTAVGTVTIAAFAGAGGLGWLINLGLNANDADLVHVSYTHLTDLSARADHNLHSERKISEKSWNAIPCRTGIYRI